MKSHIEKSKSGYFLIKNLLKRYKNGDLELTTAEWEKIDRCDNRLYEGRLLAKSQLEYLRRLYRRSS